MLFDGHYLSPSPRKFTGRVWGARGHYGRRPETKVVCSLSRPVETPSMRGAPQPSPKCGAPMALWPSDDTTMRRAIPEPAGTDRDAPGNQGPARAPNSARARSEMEYGKRDIIHPAAERLMGSTAAAHASRRPSRRLPEDSPFGAVCHWAASTDPPGPGAAATRDSCVICCCGGLAPWPQLA